MSVFPSPLPLGYEPVSEPGVIKLIAVSQDKTYSQIMSPNNDGTLQHMVFIDLSQAVSVLVGDYIAYLLDDTLNWWVSVYRQGSRVISINCRTGAVNAVD